MNLTKTNLVILGFEIANPIVAHLTESKIMEDGSVSPCTLSSFSAKEVDIIKYLAGYVFGTVYRRLRNNKYTRNMLGEQSLCVLLAGKTTVQDSAKGNTLTSAKNRGGLWIVSSEVFEIFAIVENTFRKRTAKFQRKIDSKVILYELLKYPVLLANYKVVCDKAAEKVSKEISLNLLEHLIMIYIHT